MTLDLPTNFRRAYFVVDTQDILLRLFDEIASREEVPIVEFDNSEKREWFMRDLCNVLAFNPTLGRMSNELDATLDRASKYLGQPFSVTQRLLWRRFTFDLYDRFVMFRFYENDDRICSHDYVQMIGHNILMRQYGD